MIAKLCLRLYSVIAHGLALAALVYLVGFIGDVFVPWSIDSGGAGALPGPVASAMALDIALITLFGAQHWGMRRFRGWARFLPEGAERPTYLLATVAATAALVALWRPIPHVVWSFESDLAVYGLSLAYFAAWGVMLTGGVRGLRPCSLALSPTRAALGLRVASEASRPARRAWYLIPLITPHMTIGHLVFALGLATLVMLASILQDDEARAAAQARGQARRRAARRARTRRAAAAAGGLRAIDRDGAMHEVEADFLAGVARAASPAAARPDSRMTEARRTAGAGAGAGAAPRGRLGRGPRAGLAALRALAARNFADPMPEAAPLPIPVPLAVPGAGQEARLRRPADGAALG